MQILPMRKSEKWSGDRILMRRNVKPGQVGREGIGQGKEKNASMPPTERSPQGRSVCVLKNHPLRMPIVFFRR